MIVSIGVFQFKRGQGRIGLSHLREYAAFTSRLRGCLEAHLARSLDTPERFLLYSRWDSPESHAAVATQLRRSQEAQRNFHELVQLLEKEPTFGRFELL
jgi:quinol monooxygenase YgiN